jgi:isoleucyl-tRNA synthetase
MERSAFVSAGCGLFLRGGGALWGGASVRRGLRDASPIAARGARLVHASAASNAQAKKDGGSQRKGKDRGRGDASPSAYSNTVNLPQTAFSQRAESAKREPQLQEFWERERIYEELSRQNPGEKYVLHDGPPFANGPLHCGHALNKTLKDFIVKYKLLRGKKAVFVPGWDTHGLPIELKVIQGMSSTERKNASVLEMRERAKAFALEAVENQAAGFKRFGVWGDWNDPYLTLNPEYEAAQIGVFGDMFLKGYIYRGRKPVHWSPSSRTALAEAELEYPEGHKSRSCYCAFRGTSVPKSAPDEFKTAASQGNLALSIWTTTPWTIPANRAIAVNSNLTYALVSGLDPSTPDLQVIIAKDLVDSVYSKLKEHTKNADDTTSENSEIYRTPKVVAIALGRDLIGIEYQHALETDLVCRVVEGGDYITTETGTGLVHTAPGHGQEDYLTGLREGLEIASPVDDAGRFTSEAANGQFTGMSVLGDGNAAVLAALAKNGSLLLEESYQHKYPYDWRTKKPTIFRATEQWFASIDSFRESALKAIDKVQWTPSAGIKRIRGMVEVRGDWCLSRQRSWGLPIPVFYDDNTGDAIMTQETIDHVKTIFADRGSNAWWEMDSDDLLPESFRGRDLRKGLDTMDVWFDSGTSWASVAAGRNTLSYPADLYLEGSDQHRGWFQSSMLTSIATRGEAPYKSVLTHGFVLDEQGMKMSKSTGNGIDPLVVITGGKNQKTDPPYGADVLRLWVASVDYTGDVLIGPQILKQVSDNYRKLRNTVRYMLGNLNDFNPKTSAVCFENLPSLDQFILYRLQLLSNEAEESFESFSFYRVYQALQRFAVVDLSNFYLDIAKDRLYIPEQDSVRRRTCQTVMAEVLETFARIMSPILPHMAEDVWQNLPYRPLSNNSAFPDAKSVFESGWVRDETGNVKMDAAIPLAWDVVLEVRDSVNKVLEAARIAKLVGAPMEANVTLYIADPSERQLIDHLGQYDNDVDDLKRAFIVSGVTLVDDLEAIRRCTHHNLDSDPLDGEPRFAVGVNRATAPKCDRCWHYDESVGTSSAHPLLCGRCSHAVIEMGISSAPAMLEEAVSSAT